MRMIQTISLLALTAAVSACGTSTGTPSSTTNRQGQMPTPMPTFTPGPIMDPGPGNQNPNPMPSQLPSNGQDRVYPGNDDFGNYGPLTGNGSSGNSYPGGGHHGGAYPPVPGHGGGLPEGHPGNDAGSEGVPPAQAVGELIVWDLNRDKTETKEVLEDGKLIIQTSTKKEFSFSYLTEYSQWYSTKDRACKAAKQLLNNDGKGSLNQQAEQLLKEKLKDSSPEKYYFVRSSYKEQCPEIYIERGAPPACCWSARALAEFRATIVVVTRKPKE